MQARILHQAVAALSTGAYQCGRSIAFGTPDVGNTSYALATCSRHAAGRARRAAWLPASNARIRRVTYIVRQGDSLALISTRFRVSVTELLQWNQISVDQYLQPGQRRRLYIDVTEQST